MATRLEAGKGLVLVRLLGWWQPLIISEMGAPAHPQAEGRGFPSANSTGSGGGHSRDWSCSSMQKPPPPPHFPMGLMDLLTLNHT